MKYSIRRLASFETLFSRLTKKAVKLGLPAPTYTVLGERQETVNVHEIHDGESRLVGTAQVVVHDLEILGLDPVKLPGWNFAARVETTPAGNLLFGVQGLEIPTRFSTSGCTCDHCNFTRNRIYTYLVLHAETGEWKQVGSTCIADFLGGNSAEALAAAFAFYADVFTDMDAFQRAESNGEGCTAAFSLRTTLAQSIELSSQFGWLSRSKAYDQGGTATADRVLTLPRNSPVSDESLERADEAIAYFASLPQSAQLDGLTRNAHIISNAGYCSEHSFGLACALHVCYRVAVGKKDREARMEWQREHGQYIGTPGKRIKGLIATIKRVFHYESEWGTTCKTIMEDDSGNVLVGKDLGDEGDRIQFTATVKEHTEYNGIKQTVVLRAANIVSLNPPNHEEQTES